MAYPFIFPLSLFLYLNGIIITFAFTGPDTFSDLAESVSPSVVNISTTGVIEQTGPEVPSIEDFFNFPFNMPRSEPSEREFSSLGSGFVISEDGFIVTNNHVVENASDIQVTFTDGTKIEAELIAADAETDLALLKVDTNNLDYLEFGDSDTAKVGNWYFLGYQIGKVDLETMRSKDCLVTFHHELYGFSKVIWLVLI